MYIFRVIEKLSNSHIRCVILGLNPRVADPDPDPQEEPQKKQAGSLPYHNDIPLNFSFNVKVSIIVL